MDGSSVRNVYTGPCFDHSIPAGNDVAKVLSIEYILSCVIVSKKIKMKTELYYSKREIFTVATRAVRKASVQSLIGKTIKRN